MNFCLEALLLTLGPGSTEPEYKNFHWHRAITGLHSTFEIRDRHFQTQEVPNLNLIPSMKECMASQYCGMAFKQKVSESAPGRMDSGHSS
jgi:hypothetical protein